MLLFFSWKGVKYSAPKVTLHKGINVSVYDKEFQFWVKIVCKFSRADMHNLQRISYPRVTLQWRSLA